MLVFLYNFIKKIKWFDFIKRELQFFNRRSRVLWNRGLVNRSPLYLTPSRSLTVAKSLRTHTLYSAAKLPPRHVRLHRRRQIGPRRAVEGAAGSIQIEDEQHADANKSQLRRLRVTPSAQTKSTAAGHVWCPKHDPCLTLHIVRARQGTARQHLSDLRSIAQ
jgi:hypothetical protein